MKTPENKMSAQDKATKFEAGKIYFARSFCSYDTIIRVKIKRITPKMVKYVELDMLGDKEVKSRKIVQHENCQTFSAGVNFIVSSSSLLESDECPAGTRKANAAAAAKETEIVAAVQGESAHDCINKEIKLEAEKQNCEATAEVAAEAALDIEELEDAETKPMDSSESEAKKLAIAAEIIGWQAFKDGKKCVPALDRNLDSLLENLPAGTGLAIIIYKRWARGWTDANLAAPVVCEEETLEEEAERMESEGPEEAKTSLTIESAMTIDSVDEGLLEANGVWGGEFRGQWKYKILYKNEKFFRSSDRGLALGHAISAYNSIPVADRVGTKEEAYDKINKARYGRLNRAWGSLSTEELSGMMQDCKELSSSLFNSALNGMDARPFSVAMNRSVRNRLSVGYVGETIADLAFYMEERAKIEAMAE